MAREPGRYLGYTGKKQWIVSHQKHGECRVFAPDKDSAMVAAAAVWRTAWTAEDFYTGCEVSPR